MKILKHKEFVNEAKSRRAWEGKIEQIDNLLAWMYEQDILNKGEKSKKDTIFRQYYRYYNDGDFPRALANKGYSKYDSQEKIELALEEYLETFIKSILSKYLPKINREQFRYDNFLNELNQLISIVEHYDIHGFVTYWSKETTIDDEEYQKHLTRLRDLNTTLEDAFADFFPEYNNVTKGVAIRKLRSAGTEIPQEILSIWQEVQDSMDSVAAIIYKLIRVTKRAKETLL